MQALEVSSFNGTWSDHHNVVHLPLIELSYLFPRGVGIFLFCVLLWI